MFPDYLSVFYDYGSTKDFRELSSLIFLLVLTMRLIEIDIASLALLFGNRSLICHCPLLKDIGFSWFQEIFSIFAIFENFDIALVLLGQFQNFQKCTRAIYPKSPSQICDY